MGRGQARLDYGIRGILLNIRNIPIMSMPIESMLLDVNSNFLVFSVSSDDMMGQSFASLVPTVAVAESTIGMCYLTPNNTSSYLTQHNTTLVSSLKSFYF
ncbi:hypothetical protein QVD17_15641 [Tagetes erecta]|uniref:Uncharacterized protein n=1 Tax=Tagetes erecta TaxID=13708 RepID=A0AAD8KPK1_TARER|nr:hypothetical protein QVD17_15641 [Tagetes erecta]